MYSSGETPSSSGETPHHQADPTDPARHDAAPAGAYTASAGQAGEHPHPRDGADPVVVERGVESGTGCVAGAEGAIITSVSRPAPEDGHDRGAEQTRERHRRRRSVGPRHDAAGGAARRANTTMSRAPKRGDAVEGEQHAGLLVERLGRAPSVVPLNSSR